MQIGEFKLRSLLALCAFCTAVAGFSYVTNGLVYGEDTSLFNNRGTTAGYVLWLGCVDDHPEFLGFRYGEAIVNAINTTFEGSRLVSFVGYRDPFFGKVADVWVEGYYNGFLYSGRATVAHFRVTQSEWPGTTFSYFTMDIYLPGHLDRPVQSTYGIGNNKINILIGQDAGLAPGAGVPSNKGVAYGGLKADTNRNENASSEYWVANNGLLGFAYLAPNVYFRGDRVRSFQCTDHGFFGKQAEFWLDGRLGQSKGTVGRSVIARVIVTQTASVLSADFMYIAFYLPGHPDAPIYERFLISAPGSNHILCK